MKPPLNELNLTAESIQDFIERSRLHSMLRSNKSHISNITNDTSDELSTYQAVNCSDYCEGSMRHIFDDYKQYHGYVTLVVSIII